MDRQFAQRQEDAAVRGAEHGAVQGWRHRHKDLITQRHYDAGMAQMGLPKDFSSRYVEESGYALSSEDGLVEEWIKPGLRGRQRLTAARAESDRGIPRLMRCTIQRLLRRTTWTTQ
ncbi:hypothetical protein KWH19_20495 [Xanthomonas campestris pv. pennamericanum]|uniref:hypothetical protein n=1 Tax=Xanthomonas euvesicatoria TaxID=456327 RepID=UPI001C484A95|nr:hypothetical protein [Xanthomonas euvesicatoria]MBV6812069.1 hypothetical protein [Xanthomonas campestris pv. pennamericanum]